MSHDRPRPRRVAAWTAAAALAVGTLTLGLAAPASAAGVSVSIKDGFGNDVDTRVYAYRETATPGTYALYNDYFVHGTTPGAGSSTIDLPDGNYKFEFDDVNDRLRTEFYDNQLSLDAAAPVAVGPTPLTLNPVVLDARNAITGTTLAAGVPVGGITVSAGGESTTTNSAGQFYLPLDPGTYTVRFSDPSDRYAAEYYLDQYTAAAATPVAVAGGDVSLGNVNLGPGAAIGGVVTGPTGAPLRGITAYAFTETAPFFYGSDTTDSTGAYTIDELPPATYKVAFFDGNGEFLSEYWNDSTTVAGAAPIAVVADQGVGGINASLAADPAGGTLPAGTDASGFVRNTSGAPVAQAIVTAYDTPAIAADRKVVDLDFTDTAGRYFLTNLNGDNQFKLSYSDGNDLSDAELPYLTTWYNGKRSYNTADPVTVAGAPVALTDVIMTLSGGIQGLITNEAGTALPYGVAEVYDPNGNPVGLGDGRTDGGYAVKGLRPGKYAVRFLACDYDDNCYVPEWYSNAATQEKAKVVTVTSGAFTSGINGALTMDLRSVEAPTVVGKARVGRTISADPGLWNLTGDNDYTYQWLRGSKVVGTLPTYKVAKADAGKRLSVRVTATNVDRTGQATSKPVKALFASKVKTVTKKGVLKVKVKVKGLKAKKVKGKVKIKKGKTTLAKLKVVKGVAKIRLTAIRGLKAGKNKLTVVYVGTGRIASDDAKLTIKR